MSELARRRSHSRKYLYDLQDAAGEVLGEEYRVSHCMKISKTAGGVQLLYNGQEHEGKRARLNVCSCGSILCPVCAQKIHAEDREKVERLVTEWVKQGLTPVFLTATLQHNLVSPLDTLYDALLEAWRSVFSGDRTGERKRLVLVLDQVKTPEIRFGLNGWHPHLHALLAVDLRGLEENEKAIILDELSTVIFSRYQRKVERLGHKAVQEAYDFRLTSGAGAAAKYITKLESGLASELTEGEDKDSRSEARSYTFFQLLALYARGERKLYGRDLASLIREYAQATRGRRHISFSRGCKALIPDLEEEKPEEDQERPEEWTELAFIDLDTYRAVVAQHKRAELLEVGNTGDAARVAEFLALIILRSLRRSEEESGPPEAWPVLEMT